MNKTLALAIRIAADATGTSDVFDQVGASARSMSDDVERAGDTASSGLDKVSGAAENMDDKAGKATGALGALSAGFELVGLEKYAGALQSASMATDFASGVAQSFTLLTELESLALVRAKVATIGQTVATKAATVATKAQAVAMRVLNLVLRANPIGLLITAILLAIAVFTTLYKKNEAFRTIVQAVMRAARDAVVWVIDKAKALYDRFGLVVDFLRERVPAAFGALRDRVGPIMERVSAPFRGLIDLIQRVIDKIQAIDFPDLPSLPGWITGAASSITMGRPDGPDGGITASGAPGARLMRGASGGGVQIIIQGALDPDAVARQVGDLLARRNLRLGFS